MGKIVGRFFVLTLLPCPGVDFRIGALPMEVFP